MIKNDKYNILSHTEPTASSTHLKYLYWYLWQGFQSGSDEMMQPGEPLLETPQCGS